jgi:hypothetical protein
MRTTCAVCGHNAEFSSVKVGGTYRCHYALKA